MNALPTVLKIAGTLLVLGLIAAIYLHWDNDGMIEALRATGPVPFFAGLAVLPAFGVPVTPFYVLAGVTFHPLVSLVGTIASIALNLVLSYFIAKSGLRRFLLALLRPTRFDLPKTPPKHPFRFTLMVKLAPGIPLFLKNYFLVLAGVPFGIYFWLSLPVAFAYAAAFLLLGDSFRDQDYGQTLVALAALGALVAVLAWARHRFEKRKAANGFGEDP